MKRSVVLALFLLPVIVGALILALAKPDELAPVLTAILQTVVFGFLGIALLVIGFALFDALSPYDLERELVEQKNVALAIVVAAAILAIGAIVCVTISG